jgi:hypothetical protein
MKKLVFLSIALMVSTLAIGQVDLSGTWKINTSKSKLGGEFMMSPQKMIINQSGNTLEVEKHSDFQGQVFTTNDTFTLDGKECVNTGFMDSEKKSTAVWSTDKKSLTITSKTPMGGEEMTLVEVYSMNGNHLSVELTASSSFGDMSETGVYDKQ